MTTEKETASWLPWVIIAVLGFMLWQRTPMPKPGPKPEPSSDIRQVVQKMTKDTQAGYAREFQRAAADVGNGAIKDEEALWKQLKEGLDDVRSAASDDLNRALDAAIPTTIDDGSRGAVSTFLRSVSDGFQ